MGELKHFCIPLAMTGRGGNKGRGKLDGSREGKEGKGSYASTVFKNKCS